MPYGLRSSRKIPRPGCSSFRNNRKARCTALPLHPLTYIELQLPPPPVARHAPQLQHARLRHDALESHRHYLGRLARVEADLHGRELFQSVAEIFDQIARLVVLPARAGGETDRESGGGGERAER